MTYFIKIKSQNWTIIKITLLNTIKKSRNYKWVEKCTKVCMLKTFKGLKKPLFHILFTLIKTSNKTLFF